MPAEVINATEKNKLAIPYYVGTLALGIPAIFLGLQIAGWIGFVRIIADGHGDFRQLYIAGYMMRSGHAHELYEYSAQKRFQDELISREQIALPFNHLAHEALLYAPFSVVRYQVGYCAFLVFNLAVLAFSYRLLRPYLSNLAQVYGWLPWVLLVTFLPVGIALMQGQDSVILFALLIGTFVALHGRQDVKAGLCLGLGIFKFQIVIPIALLHLAWRRWQLSCGFAASSTACILLSFAMAGANQMKAFIRMLISMSVRLSSAEQIHLWHSSQLYAQSQRIGLRSRQCQPLAAHFAIIYFCRFTYPIRNGVLVWPPLAKHGCFFAGHHGKRPGQLPFADS